VFLALGRAVSPRELADVRAELPADFQPLLAGTPGPHPSIMTVELFLQRVADRAGVPPEEARRAADAVLETLAERIAAGEVEDLLAQLPVELHGPLRRGAERHRDAERLPLDGFLQRVAGRADVPLERAREYARAVFATLREAVTDREFYDLSAELPREYGELLATR
jgi:uncharacterized protein (DUF2267 family)